jgi:Putative addiction module component
MDPLPLKKMTIADKLRAMEELWADITHDQGKYTSPTWHFDALDKTELDIREGRVIFKDWAEAKKSIRRRARGRSKSQSRQ